MGAHAARGFDPRGLQVIGNMAAAIVAVLDECFVHILKSNVNGRACY